MRAVAQGQLPDPGPATRYDRQPTALLGPAPPHALDSLFFVLPPPPSASESDVEEGNWPCLCDIGSP